MSDMGLSDVSTLCPGDTWPLGYGRVGGLDVVEVESYVDD